MKIIRRELEMKKRLSVFLALVLCLVSVFSTVSFAEAGSGERVTVTWYAAGMPYDTTEVNKKATELLNAAGINVDFQLNWLGFDTYYTTITNMISTGEPFDIFNHEISAIDTYALSNGIYEITDEDLETLLPGAVEAMGKTMFDNCRYNGHLYAVPVAHEWAQEFGVEYNERLAEELGIDMSKVNTVADLDALFAEVYEKAPEDVYVMSMPESNRPFMVMADLNYINNSETLCLCMDMTDDSKGIFNPFEDEKMITAIQKIREWLQKGYLLADWTIDYTSLNLTEGKVFCKIRRTKPGDAEQESNAFNTFRVKLLSDKHYATFNDFPGGWGNAISGTSEHPKEAMQVLNFVYTSPEMMDLLTFGIEGTDYTRDENGYVAFGENGYAAQLYFCSNWQMGNHYLCSITQIQAERGLTDIWDQLKEFNDTATVLDSTGFFFDTSAYQAEITAVTNTYYEYWAQLFFSEDFDATLKQFNEELYANGLQTLKDACIEQYNEFLAAKGK